MTWRPTRSKRSTKVRSKRLSGSQRTKGGASVMLLPTSSGHDAERHCRLYGVDARTSPTPPDVWIRMSLAHRGFV